MLLAALILASTANANALCTPDEVQHDRTLGPYVTYVRSVAAPTKAQRWAFQSLSATVRDRLTHYADYTTALREGYIAFPLPAYIMRLQPGVLTTFTSNGVPGTIDLHRFTVLYYRRTDSGLQLVGGGFVTVPLRHYTGTAAAAQLNGMLPTPLAHWHTIQNACSPPMMPRYYATFRIRGNTLDWTWPGADKFDRQGPSPKTPESDTHGRSSHQGP